MEIFGQEDPESGETQEAAARLFEGRAKSTLDELCVGLRE